MVELETGDTIVLQKVHGGMLITYTDAQRCYVTAESHFLGNETLKQMEFYDLADLLDDMVVSLKHPVECLDGKN